jgi:hypothetical protein
MRTEDGGWALTPKSEYGDVDYTAMTIQAFAPYYNSNSKVKVAVNAAVKLLSTRQMDSGGFKSMGKENAESTAQVITALSCLGINARTDERFINNNKTLLDGLLQYQLADKSFCHDLGGSSSGRATVQALYSLISMERLTKGYGSLYIISSTGTGAPQQTTQVAKPTDETPSQSSTVSGSTESTDASGTLADAMTETAGETGVATGKTTLSGESQQHEDATDSTDSSSSFDSNKKWLSLAIVLLALGICLVLVLTGKANKKNLLAVLLIATVLIGLLLLVHTEPTTKSETVSPQAIGSVAMVIQCDEAVQYINDNDVKGYEGVVPQDGIMLDQAKIQVQQDDTVLELLKRVTKDNNIILIVKSSGYVSNIGGLVERSKDFGAESGWLYSVNGEYPSVGATEYKVNDGDKIEFKYVCKNTDF